uniref:Uncharacterized protein n=1 Tax=Solanum lycopersicum TaxID=4081 RepID=A0A3Q7GE64_SOLLC
MGKTSIMALFVIALMIVSCDVAIGITRCHTSADCPSYENGYPKCICIELICICRSLNTHSIDHEDSGSSGKY